MDYFWKKDWENAKEGMANVVPLLKERNER
jgi:hypothetical protein